MTLTKIVIIMGFERSQAILAILISLLIIPGCTAPSKIVENEMPNTGVIVPERLNLIASTSLKENRLLKIIQKIWN